MTHSMATEVMTISMQEPATILSLVATMLITFTVVKAMIRSMVEQATTISPQIGMEHCHQCLLSEMVDMASIPSLVAKAATIS